MPPTSTDGGTASGAPGYWQPEERDSAGFETMQPNSLVQWVVSDFQGVTLSTGSAMTSANGFVYFTPSVPTGYVGRIKVDASANSPQGLIKDTSFQYVGAQTGVFGVVKNASFGTLTISANDNSIAPITVNVANGGFTIPLLAGLRRTGALALLQPRIQSEPTPAVPARTLARDANHPASIPPRNETLDRDSAH